MTFENKYLSYSNFPMSERFFIRLISLSALVVVLFVVPAEKAGAQTYTYLNAFIKTSFTPFDTLPSSPDTIILKNSILEVDQNYEPIMENGMPFEGVLLVDGGAINWTVAGKELKLGYNAKLVLVNGGKLLPDPITSPGCTGNKKLKFDTELLATCNGGSGAPHAFTDVNQAGCLTVIGICCNALINTTDNSGNANDLTLCNPGDTAIITALGSGTLNYQFLWTPNYGNTPGPITLTPANTASYSVYISGIFDPYVGDPYLLTCNGTVTVKINPQLNLSAVTTPVPCLSSPSGVVNLSVSGGTPNYKYIWSNGATTQDLTNVPAGTYTVTVSDAKGCSEIFSATVAVLDNTPPTISCPTNATDVADPGICSTLVGSLDATYSDNCPTVLLSYNLSGATSGSGSGQATNTVAFQSGTTTVIYAANDGANTSTCSFTVTVQDQQLPTASNPPQLTGVQCLGQLPPPNPAVVTDEADNCGTPTVAFLSDNILGGGGCAGLPVTVLRNYRVTDAFGNTKNVVQTILVADTQAPVFTSIPANLTVNCDAVPSVGTPTTTDNCSASVNLDYNGQTRVDGPCPDSYTLQRRWTATDNCGNTATALQLITVQDVTKPVFTSVPANVTVSCEAIPAVGTPVASDNCDAAVAISYSGEARIDGACPDTYTLRRTWTAADNCGNTATALQVITVQDITKPVFSFVPANTTVECNAVPAVGTPTATDNCDLGVNIQYNGETRTNGSCPYNYTLTRRWTATDNCGNTASAQQVITVQDITKPVFAFVPANITVNCDAVPPMVMPTANDNCSAQVSILYNGETKTNGSCVDSYTLRRQWTASDECGNTATAEQILTVQDVTKPVFGFVPPNITVNCDALPPVSSPTATDNCDGSVSILYNGEIRINGACLDSYTLERRWTATDNCGNANIALQVITVQDTTRPIFTFIPPNLTVNCDAIPAVSTPSATDNCDASVAVFFLSETRINGACADSYTLERRWTATDNCGNVNTALQILTVQDTTKPVFTSIPADVTANCDNVPPVGTPSAVDNCDGAVSITYNGQTESPGPFADNYTISRTWTAVDNCGNSATALQQLYVQDTTSPILTFVPIDITVSCDAVPPPGTPSATDNCDTNVEITYDGEERIDGQCADTYLLKRRWTATDNGGNTDTGLQVITVLDIVAPVFTFVPADTLVDCHAIPAPGTPTATDNCDGGVTITYNGEQRADGPCADRFILFRMWTASDNCGNTTSAVQALTVQDTTKPVFTFVPVDTLLNCDAVPPAGSPVVTDNCDGAVSLVYNGETRTDGNCPDTYTLTRRWTAEDNCGNTATAVQVIMVQDTTKPVFTFVPADTLVDCNDIPGMEMPSASDNCDTAPIINYTGEIRTDGACPDTYMLTRSWTVEDNCGNITTASQILMVQDTTKPVFTFIPADTLVNCDAVPPTGTPTASDKCDSDVTITYNGETRSDGNCPDNYTLTRLWTATDNCGNTTTAVQMLSVQDTTKPVFTFVPADTLVDCDAVPAPGSPTATDNCDSDVSITYDGEIRTDGNCADNYILHRQWTVTDNCGNTATAEQFLTVQDTTKPAFTFVPPDVVVNCDDVPVPGAPAAADNCDNAVAITYDGEVRIDGNCADNYLLERRWTAVDNCGNTVMALQVLTVQDTTKPLFTYVPADSLVDCDAIPAVDMPSAKDNCDDVVEIVYQGQIETAGSCENSYTITRNWSATDNCGNVAIATQILTVQDTTKPVFTFVPADTVANCDALPPVGIPTAIDNCADSVTIAYLGETLMSSINEDTYILLRKWSATDLCGNVTFAHQHVNVQDTVPPGIICPTDISLPIDDANCLAIVNFDAPQTSDNCSSILTVTGTAQSGDAFPIGTTIVQLEVSDLSANKSTCTFAVTVIDTTAPVLVNCPPDLTFVSPDGNCQAIATWTPPTVTDACDGYTITPVPTQEPNTIFPTGFTVVTYTATDSTGNTQTCSFTVTVTETVQPGLTPCPADITLYTDTCTAVAEWIAPVADDNCLLDTLVSTHQSGDVFPETTTTVVYTASDVWNNTTTCSFTVTVIDIVAPVFSGCPQDTVIDGKGTCELPVNFGLPTASDNCVPDPVIYAVPPSGTVFPVGHSFVRIFVEDPSGNQDTCIFKITILGPPLGFSNTPPNQVFNQVCEAVATWTPPTPTGVCGPVVVTSNFEPGDTFPIGTTTVIYTVADTLGYSATTSFTITVTENTAPVFNCPPSPVVVNTSGAIVSDPGQFLVATDTIATCDGVELSFNNPQATDNCHPPEVLQTAGLSTAAIFNVGEHLVAFMATDSAGNTAQCNVTIQVNALQPLAPQVSDAIGCPGDDITLSTPVIAGATYFWTGPQPPYPNDNTLLVTNLQSNVTGWYTVEANVNGCITPLDSAFVRMAITPDANDDPGFEVEPGALLPNFDVLVNDIYETDDFTVELISPLEGLTDEGQGKFSYQAGTHNGRVVFVYKICSAACPDLCDRAMVTITIRETECGYIPNIITPNNDGYNDYLEIPCIESDLYPNNSMVIYNQWGDKVYEAAPYTNDPGKAWNGTFKGESGKDLPDATYFYIFKPSPDAPAIRGYIEIFR